VEQATRIDAAVMRFAGLPDEDLERTGNDPHGARLLVGSYVVRLRIEPAIRLIRVLYVVQR
jgi:hypothetical protein